MPPEDNLDVFAGADPDADESLEGLDFGDGVPEDVAPEPEPDPEPAPAEQAIDESADAEPEPESDGEGDPVPDAPEAAEAEEADEPEPEPQPVKPKSHMIPKDRLDVEVAKRRQLEAQLEQLQSKAAPPVEEGPSLEERQAQADDMLSQANEALLDGDTKKAGQLQREAYQLLTPPTKAQEQQAPVTVEEVRESIRVEDALSAAKSSFPQLDDTHESFDELILEDAVMYEQAYLQRGFTRSQALAKAVETTARMHNLETPKEAAPAAKPPARNTKPDVRRAVKAAGQQPPASPGLSTADPEATTIDITTLSEEEFDALPEATLKKLRGDIL